LIYYTKFIVLLALMTASLGYTQTPEAEYEQRLKALQASISELQKELKKVKNSRGELQQSLENSEVEIGKKLKNIKKIEEALSRQKKQLSQLRNKRSQLDKRKQQQQHNIAETINQAYRLGHQSHIKLLLNQEEPSRISRLMRYHEYVVNAREQKIADFLQTLKELDAIEPEIVATTQGLEKNRGALKKQYHHLKASQAQRLATLKTLNSRLKSKGAALGKMKSDRSRLQRLLDEATQALANLALPEGTTAFKQLKGKLPLPTQGKLLHRYGSVRSPGPLKWNGIFISGTKGRDVISVHHGHVIFSDYLRGHGLLLIVDHGGGYRSLYAHNQALYKETGEWVAKGEKIAAIGNSGGLTQAGLYFEIRFKGQPQNPQRWLKNG